MMEVPLKKDRSGRRGTFFDVEFNSTAIDVARGKRSIALMDEGELRESKNICS